MYVSNTSAGLMLFAPFGGISEALTTAMHFSNQVLGLMDIPDDSRAYLTSEMALVSSEYPHSVSITPRLNAQLVTTRLWGIRVERRNTLPFFMTREFLGHLAQAFTPENYQRLTSWMTSRRITRNAGALQLWFKTFAMLGHEATEPLLNNQPNLLVEYTTYRRGADTRYHLRAMDSFDTRGLVREIQRYVRNIHNNPYRNTEVVELPTVLQNIVDIVTTWVEPLTVNPRMRAKVMGVLTQLASERHRHPEKVAKILCLDQLLNAPQ